MNKAIELLKKKKNALPVVKTGTPKIVLRDEEPVEFLGGEQTLGGLVAEWKRLDAERKNIEAELELIKSKLREVGKGKLDNADRYYSGVQIGEVVVQRANKYKLNPKYSREEIIDAIGETEYYTMFGEDAVIRFQSVKELELFTGACAQAGVAIKGDKETKVKPRSSFAARLYEIGHSLGDGVEELLRDCAVDQRPSVGRGRSK